MTRSVYFAVSVLVLCLGLLLLPGCAKRPEVNYEQAYDQSLTDGGVMMVILHALDEGDNRRTRLLAMTSLYVTLGGLADYRGRIHPTAEQEQELTELARNVLDYMLIHRAELDPRLPSVRMGIGALRKILTTPDDIRRLGELSDYLTGVEKDAPDESITSPAH